MLTAKMRNAFGPAKFALQAKRAYPINDRAHAANAKARATQQFDKGNLSAGQKAQIDAKANKVLAR